MNGYKEERYASRHIYLVMEMTGDFCPKLLGSHAFFFCFLILTLTLLNTCKQVLKVHEDFQKELHSHLGTEPRATSLKQIPC